MRAKDIMSTPVVTASASTKLKRIAELMLEHDISAVPIVDDTGVLVGIVSEADIVPLQSVEDPRRHMIPAVRRKGKAPTLASQVMSINVVTAQEDDDVTRVARLMQLLHVKRLPVVADGRVTGIISRRDILKILARSDDSIQAEMQEILDDQIPLLGWFHADVSDGVVTLTGPDDAAGRKLAAVVARSIPGVVAVRFDG